MPPSFKDIERLGKQKAQSIRNQQEKLLRTTSILDKELFEFLKVKILPKFSFGKDGRITNSNTNINASRNIKQLRKYIDGNIDKRLKQLYISNGKNSLKASNRYYSLFKPSKALRAAINNKSEKTIARLMVSVFTQVNIQSQIEGLLGKAILVSYQEEDLEKSIKDLVLGKENTMGINQKFHYQNGHDLIQAQSRTIDLNFAKGLGMNYAIWTGGIINETRDFCEERNGKVYSMEELLSMGKLEWKGKKKFHNVLADCGGYNCGHYLSWITKELAMQLRKDLP